MYKGKLMNDDQIEYLREIAKNRKVKEITRIFNEKYMTNLTQSQIRNIKKRYKITSGVDCKFKKGNIPLNKGNKQEGKRSNSCYKKGNIPHNTKQVGEFKLTKGNILAIKIAQPNKWQSYHSYLWEQYHGQKLPKDKVVIFVDGDNRNFEKDNLVAITRRELLLMNKLKVKKCKSKVLIAKIKAKIIEKRENNE